MGHMAAASLNQVETTRFGELYEKMDVGDERHLMCRRFHNVSLSIRSIEIFVRPTCSDW